jgi:hypothetical protein
LPSKEVFAETTFAQALWIICGVLTLGQLPTAVARKTIPPENRAHRQKLSRQVALTLRLHNHVPFAQHERVKFEKYTFSYC